MNLTELDGLPSFALFAPAFSGADSHLLVAPLARTTSPTVVFCAFEDQGRLARGYAGPAREVRPLFRPSRLPAATLDAAGHGDAVASIRAAIGHGDVYQVCLTLRAHVPEVRPSALAGAIGCRAPRYFAWVRLPDGDEFVSASPELFFEISEGTIHAEPMKGTGATADALATSRKDEAELAMITDLLRNDLQPVCEERSVHVPCARRIITLPYATQTVSDVEGTLRRDVTLADVLESLHPGGSVTGAPKAAAHAMIRTLEPTPRGPYCGTVGLITGRRATFSILIRTAVRTPGTDCWTYGVGGGITWGSDAAEELAEAERKLGALRS
jgi:anthranilate/para-aminobenzoate synthase component I